MGQTGRTSERWWKLGVTSVLVTAGILTAALPSASAAPARIEAVVVARPGQLAAAAQAVRADGGRISSELTALDTVTATIEPSELTALAANPAVASATPDGSLHLVANSAGYDPAQDPYSLASVETATGVRSLWAQETGAGVGVALIDSGVTQIPGYLDQVVQGPNFSNTPRVGDGFGHGTFMAGIIAGDQGNVDPVANATNQEAYLGVAPSSTLVSVKVADSLGNTSLNQILQGINWVINHKAADNIRVINLSFATPPTDAYVADPLAWGVEQAWQAGIVVVVSAGNQGATSAGLENPANDPYVIAVGAEDTGPNSSTPSVATFSSWGDGTRNPDLVAPGAHIQGVISTYSTIGRSFASTGQITQTFFRGSGSSEAAAFTSGLAALLVQEHPTFTPDQIKALMVSSAQPIAGADPRAQGAGAVQPAVAAGPITAQMAAALAAPQSFPKANPSGPSQTTSSPATDCVAVGTGTNLTSNNYQGANLVGANLAGADLEGVNLQGANLMRANLAGASLAGANLAGANLLYANLAGATLAGANLAGANLARANLTNAVGYGANTPAANLWGASAASYFLKTVTANGETPFVGQACASVAGATGSSWSGSSWSGSSWSGSSWSGSSWSGSSWSGSSWSGSSWSGSSWSGSSWSGSSWSGSSWSAATWT